MDTARSRTDVDLVVPGGDGPSQDPAAPPPAERDHADTGASLVRERLWWAAGALYRNRWWIVALTILAAAASVALSLQIPNRYRAETRVLLPEGGNGLIAGALSSISPTAASLLGGSGGGFTRYMAILTSPSTLGEVVDRHGLVEVYEMEAKAAPRHEAIGKLFSRAAFEVSLDYDYLSISVLDEDPQRSAQLANAFVELLNERHVELTSSSASTNRAFLEERLDQAYADLDSAQSELQVVQERSGVIEPEAQASALMGALAQAQGQVALAEAQYRALETQFGDENLDVQAAAAALATAREQRARLSNGGDVVMPVPIRQLPRVQRQYQGAMQEMLIQQQIVETLLPQYEMAVLQEKRDADAVQVLDPAGPPPRKAEPRRSLIVIAATLSVFLIAIALVLSLAWLRRFGPATAARLQAAAASP